VSGAVSACRLTPRRDGYRTLNYVGHGSRHRRVRPIFPVHSTFSAQVRDDAAVLLREQELSDRTRQCRWCRSGWDRQGAPPRGSARSRLRPPTCVEAVLIMM